MEDGNDQDTFCFHAINDAVALDEKLTDPRILRSFRNVTPKLGELLQVIDGFEDPCDQTSGVVLRILPDVAMNRLEVRDRGIRPDELHDARNFRLTSS